MVTHLTNDAKQFKQFSTGRKDRQGNINVCLTKTKALNHQIKSHSNRSRRYQVPAPEVFPSRFHCAYLQKRSQGLASVIALSAVIKGNPSLIDVATISLSKGSWLKSSECPITRSSGCNSVMARFLKRKAVIKNFSLKAHSLS